jgi:hypothetical protein
MEYLMAKLTDLILVIPLKVDISSATNNMFLHYLNHEDWFEAAPLSGDEATQLNEGDMLKVQNKDLEPPSIQDAKDKPKNIKEAEKNQVNLWETICYPGSLKCLYE